MCIVPSASAAAQPVCPPGRGCGPSNTYSRDEVCMMERLHKLTSMPGHVEEGLFFKQEKCAPLFKALINAD